MPRSPDIEAERRPNEVLSFATEPGDVIAFRTSTLHGGALILTRQRGGHSRCVILAKIVISLIVQALPLPLAETYKIWR